MKLTTAKRLAVRHQRNLEIEISFLEGLIRRDPTYVDALQILGDDYTRSGDASGVLRVDKQLARLQPGDPTVHYNLACSFAVLGQITRAATALARAIDLGYRDFNWLEEDPDLENLRSHDLYRDIKSRIKSVSSVH